ncbi:MAG: hypothetical protein P8181_14705, partial [bacterium]
IDVAGSVPLSGSTAICGSKPRFRIQNTEGGLMRISYLRLTTATEYRQSGGFRFVKGKSLLFAFVSAFIFAVGAASAEKDTAQSKAFSGSLEETVRLGATSRLIIGIGGERVEYGPGDLVQVKWVDGIVFVNDYQVRPFPVQIEDVASLSVDRARKSCGEVPMVIEYVNAHKGERPEADVWNEAMRIWGSRVDDLVTDAEQLYAVLVNGDDKKGKAPLDPDEAARRVAKVLRDRSDLVHSAIVDATPSPTSQTRFVSFVLKGREHGKSTGLILTPNPRKKASGPELVSRESYENFELATIRNLSSDSVQTTVKFIDGTLTIERVPLRKENER